jgi:hypothetical protein
MINSQGVKQMSDNINSILSEVEIESHESLKYDGYSQTIIFSSEVDVPPTELMEIINEVREILNERLHINCNIMLRGPSMFELKFK